MSIKKKIFAVFFAVTAVMLMQSAAFAYTGSGTESDPYIITDYKEFADLSKANISTTATPKEKWYKLGCDISAEDDTNNTYAILIGNNVDYESYMHLDLAGYTMSRTAITTDPGMFRLQAGKLFIDDSEGTGRIECQIGITDTPKTTADTGAIFHLKSNSYFYATTELIINGGTFSTPNNKYPCIKAYSANGTIRINDGTFLNGPVETAVDANYNAKTKTYIKGGSFSILRLSDLGETIIYDCIVTEKIFSSNSLLKYMIASNSTVTCNGSAVTDLNVQGKEGYIVITSPDKHTVTFRSNGADGEMPNARAYTGDTFTFPECKFTAPEGHYFNNWLYNGQYYSVGDTLTVSGDMTVTAQWEPKKYIVSFATGGVYTEPEQIVPYGSTASKPDVPYCYNGKYVDRWDTALGNEFDFSTKITENIFLYAHWVDISNTITGLTNKKTYTVYYGDPVVLSESKTRNDSTLWSVTVGGRTIPVETLSTNTSSACIIPADAAAFVGKSVAAIFTKTTTTNGRSFTTTTQIYLNYVYKQGDINGSGDIDSEDAAMLLKHISGKEALDSEVLKRGDMNYDGKYDMLDVIAILNKAA